MKDAVGVAHWPRGRDRSSRLSTMYPWNQRTMKRSYYYGYNYISVLPDDLFAFAWSAPMRELAEKLEMSDVGLKKHLAAYDVFPPPQGYWNKVHAGKPVPKLPKAPPRQPGERGRFMMEPLFAKVLPQTPPISSAGPFASPCVPENLDELFEQELKAIGRVGVPASLDRFHSALAPIMKKEQRRREKAANSHFHWDAPKFDAPLDKRRLRIFNGIFLALAKRGHGGEMYESGEDLSARAIIGNTGVGLSLDVLNERQKRVRRGYMLLDPALPAKTPLKLCAVDGDAVAEWADDEENGTLETQIASIAAKLIVLGEANFRRHLRENEEQIERERLRLEAKRQAEIAQRNAERLEALRTSGELLRQANDIRALVANLRQAITEGAPVLDNQQVELWERWALAEADKLDPIRSGHIMSHLLANVP